MAKTGVEVEGLNKVVRGLLEAGVELDDLKDAFAQIASQGADAAARYAPRRTGALAATIRGNKAKNKAIVTAGRAKVRYAGPINYGWTKRNVKSSHFMQRADADLRPRVVQMLEDNINHLLHEKGLA